MTRLRTVDELSVAMYRGVIICDPDGRNGGGYVVTDVTPQYSALKRIRKETPPPPAPRPIRGSDRTLAELARIRPLFARLVAVSKAADIAIADLRGPRRFKPLVYARAAFSILATETMERDGRASLPRIGAMLGGLDHTTVLYHTTAHKNTPAVRNIVSRAKRLLGIAEHDA